MAIVTDGLVLYLHGACGKNNPATRVWKDLSGNGNDGQLMNFNFTEDSGWGDGGLRFDGVDDYVQLPDLALNPDNFTIQVDDKIRAFNGDKVMTENGDEWGRNLIKNSTGLSEWRVFYGVDILNNDGTFNPSMAKIARVNTRYWGAEIKGAPTSLGDVWSFSFIARTGTSDGDIRAALMGRTIDDRHIGNWMPYIEKVYDLPNGWALYKGENCVIDREEVAYISMRFCNAWQTNDGYHDYALPKLEKGDKATPWTPAPEDITEANIIDHTAPFVENNTIHTFRLYNRALTDEEIMQNYQAGHEWIPQIGEREATTTMKSITSSLSRKGTGKREVISIMKPITTSLERKGKGKREVISTMKPITSELNRKGVGRREVITTIKPITADLTRKGTGKREVTTTIKPITADLTRKGTGKREVISTVKPISSSLERKGKGKREVTTTMKPITSELTRKGIGRREVTTKMKPITSSISKKLPPIHAEISTKERNPHINTRERTPKLEVD